jgi:hypothetical protein
VHTLADAPHQPLVGHAGLSVGVVELPYLLDLGMHWQYKGRTEVASLYALLLQLAPEWAFRDTAVLIDTPEPFFAYIHVENGEIKLLREALNIVATARAFFPNGLAEIAHKACPGAVST